MPRFGDLFQLGSSPPARGPPSNSALIKRAFRLIPACAGTTRTAFTIWKNDGAHPRLRGDHGTPRSSAIPTVGSSPPARGPPILDGTMDASKGLIPACAGTTRSSLLRKMTAGAHPRLRGDHQWSSLNASQPPGSSPPARGPQACPSPTLHSSGLIPACAGTTVPDRDGGGGIGAHPRLRGDHRGGVRVASSAKGSSPPARGPPAFDRPLINRGRLIPACAGTTPEICCLTRRSPAHPRLRGDHETGRNNTLTEKGSSPPARGPRQ